MWIRIQFFFLNTDPDPGSQTNADPNPDPDPGQTFRLYMKNMLKVGTVVGQKHTYEVRKAYLKGRNPGLFVNFCQFRCSWIRIRIPNTDSVSDPGQTNKCGGSGFRSGSTTLIECEKHGDHQQMVISDLR